jgi:hypothetical protein
MNMGPTKKHLNYSRTDQLKDVIPGFLLAGVMALCTLPLTYLPINDFAIMGLQVLVACAIYLLLSIRFKIEAYYYCKKSLIEYYSKKRRKRN